MSSILPAGRLRGTLSLTQVSQTADDDGLANTRINATAFKRPAVFSRSNYQFLSYYSRNAELIIARREFDQTQLWQLHRTGLTPANSADAHCVSVIAVDGDGFLHVAWGMHNHEMRYAMSSAPVTNAKPIELHTPSNQGMHSKRITYPEFTAIPNSPDLLFMYRTGGAGNGDYHLLRWLTHLKMWESVNADLNGRPPWITGTKEGNGFSVSSPYPTNLAIDSRNCVHVAWTWRSGKNSRTEFKDYQSNHHILYARSNPLSDKAAGEAVWYDGNGNQYALDGEHHISEANAKPVLKLPEGSSLINTASLTLDTNEEPIIASWYAPKADLGDHTRQYMLLAHEEVGWKEVTVSSRAPETVGRLAESELSHRHMARPIVVTESGHTVIIYSDCQKGGNIIAAVNKPPAESWEFHQLTAENAGVWEPSYDPVRWREHGILSMLYQPSGLGAAAHPVFLLEWDVRGFFSLGGGT